MEERPTFEPPSVPAPDTRPSAVGSLLGVVVGLLGGVLPAGFGLAVVVGALSGITGPQRLTAQFAGMGVIGLAALVVAWRLARAQKPGFVRGMIVGLALSLLLTGGSLSALLWMCRKGW